MLLRDGVILVVDGPGTVEVLTDVDACLGVGASALGLGRQGEDRVDAEIFEGLWRSW